MNARAEHRPVGRFTLLRELGRGAPMVLRGATFALIYADQAQPGAIALGDKELALLRTLRNQGVLAFRQLGG